MFNRRRKIAVAVALILALGSAAASAANYVGGKGAMPSFAGAGDALGMAMGGATKAANWMLVRSRNSVDGMLALLNPSSVRPPEVSSVPESLPRYPRGPLQPVTIEPLRPYGLAANRGGPDQAHPASFEGGFSSSRSDRLSSVDVSLPAFPSGGGSSGVTLSPGIAASRVSAVREITPAVPEPESYAMLLAGLGLLGVSVRRRGKSFAV